MSMLLLVGSTGLVGRSFLERAREEGLPLRCLVREAAQGEALRRLGVQAFFGDLRDRPTLELACRNVESVVHVGGTFRRDFDSVNWQGTVNLLDAAARQGISTFVYLSCLGSVDDPTKPYLRSKWKAEQAVLNSPFKGVVVKSSVIFGKEDHFLSWVYRMAEATTIVPSGERGWRCQPIWVGDVVTCLLAALKAAPAPVAEIGGPSFMTLPEIVRELQGLVGRPLRTLPLLDWAAQKVGRWLPLGPISPGILELLSVECVSHPSVVKRTLKISPSSFIERMSELRETP